MAKKVKTSRIRLSQCMIVKNEEANIRRALSWGRGIVWEQIVVDTGSTDKTVEIAKEMGAKVFYFDWCDDFSAAKNYAIEQVSGEWIAFFQGRRAQDSRRVEKRGNVYQKRDRHPCPLHGDVPLERRGRGVLRRTALPHIPKHEGVALLQSDS